MEAKVSAQAQGVHAGILAVPDRVGVGGQEQAGGEGGRGAEAKLFGQMEYQWDGDRSGQDGDKPQCEFVRSGDLEPGVLEEVAADGVGFSHLQRARHDLGRGAQAEEEAEALFAAKFAKAKAEEPQQKAEQDNR